MMSRHRLSVVMAAALTACVAAPAGLSRDAAVARVVAAYPELRGFEGRSLPPSMVEAAPAMDGGWQLGFVARGSGRPGILHARCFAIDARGRVTATGSLTAAPGERVDAVDLRDCRATRPG